MGVYLSKPKTDKSSEDGGDEIDSDTRYGLTSMQGWRRNMEDSHLALPSIKGEAGMGVYAVFDGHGGSAVAHWVSKHFVEEFSHNLKELRTKYHNKHLILNSCTGDMTDSAKGLFGAGGTVEPRPVSLQGSLSKLQDGLDADMEFDATSVLDDLNVIDEEPEIQIKPTELPLEAAIVCEALQATFLSLDERMKLHESRAELKCIHEAYKTEDEESDVSSELQSFLQCYLDCGKGGGVVRVTEDVSGQKTLQIFSSEDVENEGGNEDDTEDCEFPWLDDFEEEGDSSKRIEEVTDEDLVGDGHVEGTVRDTVLNDTVMVSASSSKSDAENDEAECIDSSGATKPFKTTDTPPSSRAAACEERETASGSWDDETASAARPMAVDSTTASSEEKEDWGGDRSGGEEVKEATANNSKCKEKSADTSNKSSAKKSFKPHKLPQDSQEPLRDSSLPDDTGGTNSEGPSKCEETELSTMVPYEPENCGATAVVTAVISDPIPMLIAANAGDSRVVLCRGGKAIALSKDHKPNNSRETKRIKAAGGRVIQGRVDGNLNLSRSVGDLAYKTDSGIPSEDQKITSFPDIRMVPLHPDDEFAVIACDGIWDCLKNQEIVDLVRQRLNSSQSTENGRKPTKAILSEICEELCDQCLAPNPVASEGIGCDNMTMMIVELGRTLKDKSAAMPCADNFSRDANQEPRLYCGKLYRTIGQGSSGTGSDARSKVSMEGISETNATCQENAAAVS